MNRMTLLLSPFLFALPLACGPDKDAKSPQTQTEVTSSSPTPSTTSTFTAPVTLPPSESVTPNNGATWSTGTAGSTPTMETGTPAEVPLTDEQILNILHLANAGEIEQGKLAAQKATHAKVKQFAAMMVKDHGDVETKGKDIATKNKLATGVTSTAAMTLENDAKQFTQSMQSMTGADFDRAYMETQVKEHQAVLDLIDKKLLPNVNQPDVKGLIQAVRPKIEAHLKQAKDIQATLK
jgi:putative membrane protein